MPIYQSGTSSVSALPTGVYIPSGSINGPELAAWKAAKAASGTTPAWISVLGDSISTGNNSSDPMTKAWFYQIRANLLQSYSLYGDAYGGGIQQGSIGVAGPATPYPAVPGGGAGNFNGTGFSSTFRIDTGQSWTFTTPYACTSINLIYGPQYGGTWQYSVDGGAAVPVTDSGSNPVRIQLRGLSNTTHTVLVNNASGAAAGVINAFCPIQNLSSGLGFANLAQGGAQSTNAQPDAIRQLLAGSATNSYSSLGVLGFPAGASLWILGYGINDCTNGNIRPVQFGFLWGQMVQLLKRANPCSIALFIASNPRIYSDAGQCFGSADYWDEYKKQVYKIADNYGCIVVDIDKRWGQTPVAQGYLTVGNGHPGDAGQTDIAAAFTGVL